MPRDDGLGHDAVGLFSRRGLRSQSLHRLMRQLNVALRAAFWRMFQVQRVMRATVGARRHDERRLLSTLLALHGKVVKLRPQLRRKLRAAIGAAAFYRGVHGFRHEYGFAASHKPKPA